MNEEELFPLSWLTQYDYCPRRCGLLAIDQAWIENEYTASGRQQHRRVHKARVEKRGNHMELCELSVFSHSLGVNGKCDCVEAWEDPQGVALPYGDGRYRLYPVEYKHGTVRNESEYHIQLCAQAICLEEQFHCEIPRGAIFYIDAHRRDEVVLDESLRSQTYSTAQRVKKLVEEQAVPEAVFGPRCYKCSMQEYCVPKMKRSSAAYCNGLWNYVMKGEAP